MDILKILQAATVSELWSAFLKGQAELYFSQEAEQLSQMPNWIEAKQVLELGCGNGAYLHHLSDSYPEKTYLGVEIKEEFATQSQEQFGSFNLTFVQGDAEIYNADYKDRFDVIIYRLTLQHLKNPRLSMQIAHEYLNPNGTLIIIDSCDKAKETSHAFPLHEEANRKHIERNRSTKQGNRLITMEILKELETHTGPLSALYEVTHTSLDVEGRRLEKGIRFESEQDRRRYFNHSLLYLAILNKEYNIPIDFLKAYEELQIFLKDETSWVAPGVHFLILKKHCIKIEL